MIKLNNIKALLFVLISFFFVGCMSAVDQDGYTNDPWEPMNRGIYSFNKGVDTVLLKPVAQAYDFVFPKPVKKGVGNFFGNLGDFVSLFNAIIQLDGDATAGIASRVINNTFFGVGGLFDVATPMGNPKIQRDFGSTLARYGVKSGPYVVLPFIGPSTLRDAVGKIPDVYLNPVLLVDETAIEWAAAGLYGVNTRAKLLPVEDQLVGVTTDEYATIRDLWLQYRWSQLGTPIETDQDSIDALFELEDTDHSALEENENPLFQVQ